MHKVQLVASSVSSLSCIASCASETGHHILMGCLGLLSAVGPWCGQAACQVWCKKMDHMERSSKRNCRSLCTTGAAMLIDISKDLCCGQPRFWFLVEPPFLVLTGLQLTQ